MTFGLPEGVRACLFDLDGVLTQTARVHQAAWKQMFDAFLAERSGQRPFSADDYDAYVDGRPRADGVRAFLDSRDIHLPEGSDGDAPGAQTVRGLGNAKNEILLKHIHDDGVAVFDGSIDYVRAVRDGGLLTAVVSSSANTRDVLHVTKIEDLFTARVDGVVAADQHLAGKPAPDTFLAGAKLLGVPAAQAAVFEDALAGVEAGRAGRFGYVVGVDRTTGGPGQHGRDLLDHGADVVVRDLSELLPR